MVRVPRPEEMPRAGLEPANEPPTININVASRIGQAGRSMGNAIEALGGAFGEVAGRIGQAQDNDNYARAKLETLKGYDGVDTDLGANAGEDGKLWTSAPERYKQVHEDVDTKYPISDPRKRADFQVWRETQAWRRGSAAALRYQDAQRNQFVKGYEADLLGFEDRLAKGDVDPETFNQTHEALRERLNGLSRTVMPEAEVQQRTRELQGRLAGSLDRYLAQKDPAERERFWDTVRKGKYELDEQVETKRQGAAVAPELIGQPAPVVSKALAGSTPGLVHAVTDQTERTFDSRGYGNRTTGAITVNGRTYEFVNGGTGRGSIPLGEYSIRRYTSGAQRAAEGYQYTKDAFELSDIKDDAPGTKGQAPRQGLLIHDGNRGVTAGCIGIKGDFNQFKADLAAELQRNGGKLKLNLTPRPTQEAANGNDPVKRGGVTPIADKGDAIQSAATASGLDANVLRSIAQIESGGNPNQRTGSYRGLFQLSEADFRKYGGKGSASDPTQNALAAAAKFKALSGKFEQEFGRAPSPGELYLMHQQGESGARAHFANPDRPAWENMAKFGSESWAKKAIWGNLTPEAKKQFGSVENVTSKQFVEFWSNRVAQGAGTQRMALGGPKEDDQQLAAEAGVAEPGTEPTADTPKLNGSGLDPEAARRMMGENAPEGSTQPEGIDGEIIPPGKEPLRPTMIPMGRLAPGQVFEVKTPRGVIQIPGEWLNAIPAQTRAQRSREAAEAFKIYERERQVAADESMRNGEAHVAAFGKLPPGYDAEAIKQAYRTNPRKIADHVRRMRIAGEIQSQLADASNLPDDEVVARLEQLRPQEFEPDFAERKTIFDQAEKRALALLKKREVDPGGSVETSKEVRSVREKLVGGVPRNVHDRGALADARMQAQTRIEVPEQLRSPISADEARALGTALRASSQGNAMAEIEKLYKRAGTEWGQRHAEAVVRSVIRTSIRDGKRREAYDAMLSGVIDDQDRPPPAAAAPPGPTLMERAMGWGRNVGEFLGGSGLGVGDDGLPPDARAPAQAAPTEVYPVPGPAHIQHLKKNPALVEQFDAKFGAGAAEKAIPGIRRSLLMQGVQ